MIGRKDNFQSDPLLARAAIGDDEGGLRAPPELHGWRKAWWWFDFIILVKLARLRFIAILVVIGAVITQWDTLAAYYDKWTRPAGAAEFVGTDIEYFCPMHPAVIRDNPKEKCPICFMPLSKRTKGTGQAEPLPAGIVSRVQLSPYRMVLAGVDTWPVGYRALTKRITMVGYVEFNERGQKTVSARVAGRIDKMFVAETGRMVKAGDELVSLYSPDLLVSMQNLLQAKRSGNNSLLSSTRTKLGLLGIDDNQIDAILADGAVDTHLTIHSPIGGHIIRKYAREGQYVEEGTPLYDIADLSTVWIQAQLYEDDLAFLPASLVHGELPDTEHAPVVTATTRAFPNQPFRGTLAFVYPHVDQDTRTVTLRFEIKNPEHKLRPGSTANVTLEVDPGQVPMFAPADTGAAPESSSPTMPTGDASEAGTSAFKMLAVPESAVIDTGSQKIVYRSVSPGVYEGVLVELGPRMTDANNAAFFPVIKGLAAGDLVVTTGSFLVDAETRLNPAAGSIYFGGSGGSQASSSATSVRPTTPEDEKAKIAAVLGKLPAADRELAEAQRFCPVLPDSRLGSMGEPIKLSIDGQTVFLCCSGCKKQALAKPQETLAKVAKLKQSPRDVAPPTASSAEAKIAAALAKLSPADRKLADAQRFCAVSSESRLGSMGTPVKIMIEGQPVFLCCDGCEEEALAHPQATLDQLQQLLKAPNRGKTDDSKQSK